MKGYTEDKARRLASPLLKSILLVSREQYAESYRSTHYVRGLLDRLVGVIGENRGLNEDEKDAIKVDVERIYVQLDNFDDSKLVGNLSKDPYKANEILEAVTDISLALYPRMNGFKRRVLKISILSTWNP